MTTDPHSPIFIIGYMASGKTTFGRALARATGRTFIDLDFYIEQRFRRSIPRIFAEEGEDGFRRKEKAMLREAGEFEDTIIACGGGTPCFFDNMDYMLQRGQVVFLEAAEECIAARIAVNPDKRPLMAGKTHEEITEAVRAGLGARMPHYSRAHIRFPGDDLDDRRGIDRTIRAFLATHPIPNHPSLQG